MYSSDHTDKWVVRPVMHLQFRSLKLETLLEGQNDNILTKQQISSKMYITVPQVYSENSLDTNGISIPRREYLLVLKVLATVSNTVGPSKYF